MSPSSTSAIGIFLAALSVPSLLQAQAEPDFVKDVQPILTSSCAGCHQGAKAAGDLRMGSLDDLLRGGVSGKAITPGSAANSALVKRLEAKGKDRMPPPAPLPDGQISIIKAWIDAGAHGPQTVSAGIDFAKEVRPILQGSCFGCHSGSQPKGQLRLDSKTLAMKGGISGPVIVPGNSSGSRLLHRVQGSGREQRMPLGGQPLAPEKIATLARWIDAGAPWPDDARAGDATIEKHWAYVAPKSPAVPAVNDGGRVRNPIDNFVLARLNREGLRPAPEASRETLIRRVTLDLTGLPPTVQEIEAFVQDSGAHAYERLVERLLASPHYGERWARPWLDAVRYADTNGFEKDRRRSIWKYRDWVIDALNRDMPFDEFSIEQIAGDLLPAPTFNQEIATGFLRNSMLNEEGGVDREEAHWEVLIDRVNTVSTVWLGSTIGCAQCHNHKYDPFTQKEYYRLLAFFNNAEFADKKALTEPNLTLPTPEQKGRRDELEGQIKTLEAKLEATSEETERRQAAWERSVLAAEKDWTTLTPLRAVSTQGSKLTPAEDGSVLVSGLNPATDTYVFEARTSLNGVTGIRIEALPDASLPQHGPGRDPYGNFFLSDVRIEAGLSAENLSKVPVRKALADDGKLNDRKFKQLWTVDASREENRLSRQLVLVTRTPLSSEGESLLRIRMIQKTDFGGQGLGHFRVSLTRSANPGLVADAPANLRFLLSTDPGKRGKEQSGELLKHYRTVAVELEPVRKQIKELERQLEKLDIPVTLVAAERSGMRTPTNLRIRGAFLSKGDVVEPGTPAILPPFPKDAPVDRLGLARWLVSRENPLTARVMVNRLWATYFGHGIVETSEDFGLQGSRPTHPELLDWLAAEFMNRNWSIKAMHRLIVNSSTYRQSSRTTPEILEHDPNNRFLARGARYRLEAESIRDMALSASGLLSPKVGGPSVFPYQPDGIWDLPYNNDKWTESSGEDRFRRGLYVFVRRTAPYPSLTTFDAPSREFCTVRRVSTNTPLQALTALNDPAFFEAAQAMARRILHDAGQSDRERVIYGFRLVTGRKPSSNEVDSLLSSVAQEQRYFLEHRPEAGKISGITETGAQAPELAAWTMLSNVLLNLDETLTRE